MHFFFFFFIISAIESETFLPQSDLEINLTQCPNKNEVCGLPIWNGLLCCKGYKCKFPYRFPGETGICVDCASNGNECGDSNSGKFECCEGQICDQNGRCIKENENNLLN